jgi:hypothetical protein
LVDACDFRVGPPEQLAEGETDGFAYEPVDGQRPFICDNARDLEMTEYDCALDPRRAIS